MIYFFSFNYLCMPGIPHVVLMTKIDTICPLVKKDIAEVYKSRKIKEKVFHIHILYLFIIFLIVNANLILCSTFLCKLHFLLNIFPWLTAFSFCLDGGMQPQTWSTTEMHLPSEQLSWGDWNKWQKRCAYSDGIKGNCWICWRLLWKD